MTAVAEKLSAFAADIKISHTVFALPFALLAAFLAAGGLPPLGILGLILLCMVAARTVAMCANRLLDARLDAQNPRTASRAIPAGRLSVPFYLAAVALCVLLFELATAGFWFGYHNPWPLALSLPVLAYISAYPLMKRFTRFCHYYLGGALGLAPLCAWVAVSGHVALTPVLLCLMVLLWTAGFDIIYACQDYEVDVRSGLFSVPAKLGIARALWIARLTHLLSWSLLVAVWMSSPLLGVGFAVGMLIAVALLLYEHSLVKADNLSKLNLAFFTMNGIISGVLGVCGILDVLLKVPG